MSLFKGIRKVFKKIGGAIKKQFKRVMKVVGKAGVLGQIAMMFVLPGIGGALMKGISGAFSKIVGSAATKVGAKVAGDAALNAASSKVLETAVAESGKKVVVKAGTEAVVDKATQTLASEAGKAVTTKALEGSGMLGSKNALVRGVGTVLEAAGNFVKVGAKAFSTVTEGVSSFIGEFGKTALNKIPGVNIGSAAPDFATAWSNVQGNVMTNASETLKAFNTSIGYTPPTTGGLANYKPTARVSVDSLKAPDLLKKAVAPTDVVDKAIETVETPLPKPAEGVELYENLKTTDNSLLKRPSPLKPLTTSESMKLPGDFQGAMDQTANFGVSKPPTTNFVPQTAGPVAAADPSYYEMLKSKATDALKEFSPSSLLERTQKIPGQFLDNLGNTITKAPETAFYAQMNKQPAGYNVSTQVIGGPMPVADVSSLQASDGGTAEQASEYYKGLQRSGTGSYGFASNDGYNQFMKKFG